MTERGVATASRTNREEWVKLIRPPSPALSHSGQTSQDMIANDTVRRMNFIKNMQDSSRKAVPEGGNAYSKGTRSRQNVGMDLKTMRELMTNDIKTSTPGFSGNELSLTSQNMSKTGIYVPEEISKTALGAFVGRGRVSTKGISAAPFLMSSGLRNPAEASNKETTEASLSITASNSERRLWKYIPYQTDSLQSHQTISHAANRVEEPSKEIPYWKRLRGEKELLATRQDSPTVKLGPFSVMNPDPPKDLKISLESNLKSAVAGAEEPTENHRVDIVQFSKLKDSSGGTSSQPQLKLDQDRIQVAGLLSGAGSSRTHLVTSPPDGEALSRPHPQGVLKHSPSGTSHGGTQTGGEYAPKSVRFLEPTVCQDTWIDTIEKLPLLLEDAELTAEIDLLQKKITQLDNWTADWRTASLQMLAVRGKEIDLIRQRAADEKQALIQMIAREEQLYRETYRRLGGRDSNT